MRFLLIPTKALALISALLLLQAGLASTLHPSQVHKSTLVCGMCHTVLDTTNRVVTSETTFSVFKFLTVWACSVFMTRNFCELTEVNLVKPILDNLAARFLDSELSCARLGLCDFPDIVLDPSRPFVERVLRDKPIVSHPVVSKNPDVVKFVVFGDVHVDYDYQEGAETECSLPICCRKESAAFSLNKGDSTKAGKWGMIAKCDVPPRTVYSFIDFATEVIKPEFFVWLGDNTPHNFWEDVVSDHLHPTQDVTEHFMKKYGKLGQMYPVVGNHEGQPCDEYDVYSKKHDWILGNLTSFWEPWFTSESRRTFREIGCYSQLHPGSDLRFIGIFPLAMDNTNPYIWRNATNVWRILDWLEKELAQSERNHEAVLILNHFPLNSYFMNKEWSYRYRVLIDRYTNQIRGIFSGHTHEDSFEIIRSLVDNDVVAIDHVHPALTTYKSEYPSFRVYEMDRKTWTLMDYVQYRLYINETLADKPVWRPAYRFTEFFKVPNMEYKQYPKIVERMQQDGSLFREFMRMFWGEGPRGLDLLSQYSSALKFITCRLISSDVIDVQECTNWEYLKLEYFFGYGLLANYMSPDWSYIRTPK